MTQHSIHDALPDAGRSMQRVLVIDDDGDLRRLVRLSLDAHPTMEVVAEAANGAEALAACAEQPDIAVLDLGLPDISGEHLLPRLREFVPRLRVVVYTGIEQPTREVAVAWGADDLVRKNQEISTLVQALERAALDAPTLSWSLPCELASASEARRLVASTLRDWSRPSAIDDACLVVSELVTNAVIHAGTECTLTLRLGADDVLIEVGDTGHGTPEPQLLRPSVPGGHGLRVVSALSTAWGIVPSDLGKSVWVRLPLPRH